MLNKKKKIDINSWIYKFIFIHKNNNQTIRFQNSVACLGLLDGCDPIVCSFVCGGFTFFIA